MTELGDDWLDEQLLADDHPSERNWRRRALNGRGISDCMAALPTSGQLNIRVPIEELRYFRDWCKERDLAAYQVQRLALMEYLERHGYPPERIASFDYDR